MNALSKLRQRRGEIASRMDALLEAGLTDETRAEFDALEAEGVKLKTDIERAERLAAERIELQQPVNQPAPRMDPSERPGGSVSAQRIEMGADRAAEAPWPEGVHGLGQFFRAVQHAGQPGVLVAEIDPRLAEQYVRMRAAATGLGESKPADGGFLIQTDHSRVLLQSMINQDPLINRCFEFPISSNANSIDIPAVDETSRADGSLDGGIAFYWEDEGSSPTPSKPKFSKITLKPRKLSALVYGVNELIEDFSAFGTWLTDRYGRGAARKVDREVVLGAGAPGMLGILNAPCKITVSKETGQAGGTIVAENIDKMWIRLPPELKKEAIWLVGIDASPQLSAMNYAVGTGGQLVYMPPGGLSAAPYATLKGRPIVECEWCSVLGTEGDIFLWVPSQYVYARKGGLKAAESLHVRFIYDEMTWRFTQRIDGQSWWKTAVTAANGSTTISPVITLATRS